MHKKQMLWLSFLATVGVFTATTSVNAQQTNLSDTSGAQTTNSSSVSIDSTNGNGFSSTATTYTPSTGTISGGGIETPIQFGSSGGSGSGTGFGTGLGSASGSGGGTSFDSGTGSSSGGGSGLGTPTVRRNTGTVDSSGSADDGSIATPGGSDGGDGSSIATPEGSDGGDGGSTALEQKNLDEPQEISLNEAAELLENNLEQSVDNLLAVENAADPTGDLGGEPAGDPGIAITDDPQTAGARRIARNDNTRRNTLDGDPRRIVRKNSLESGGGCARSCANPNLPTVEARVDVRQVMVAREIVERQLEASKKFIEQVNKIEPEKNIW